MAGVEEEDGEEDGGEGHLGIAEALGLMNDDDQVMLGARRRTGNWRQEDKDTEEDALQLQQHLAQQDLQAHRERPENESPPRQRRRLAEDFGLDITLGEQLQLLPVATNLLEASNLTNVLEELERSLHLEKPGQRRLKDSGYREGHREGEEPGPRVVEEAGHRVVEVPDSRVVEESGYIAGHREGKESGHRVEEEPGCRVVEKPGYVAGYREGKEPDQREGEERGQMEGEESGQST